MCDQSIVPLIGNWLSYADNAKLKEKYREINELIPRKIQFDDFLLLVDEGTGHIYKSDDFLRISRNPLFRQIDNDLRPEYVLDIGANVGFSGLLFSRVFANSRVFSFEPNPRLTEILKINCIDNSVENLSIINKIVGDSSKDNSTFQINTTMSVDSRVTGLNSDYVTVPVKEVSLDDFFLDYGIFGNVFIKIDVQGYELKVLQGAKQALKRVDDFYIMIEFAPHWLEACDNDPLEFLEYVHENFNFSELPQFSSFQPNSLTQIKDRRIDSAELQDFLGYTKSLSRNNRGWCDLLLFKK